MKKFYGVKGDTKLSLNDLCRFLRREREAGTDEVIIRPTYICGGRDDVEMCAHAVSCYKGFGRFINPELLARHEFADCYRFVLKH